MIETKSGYAAGMEVMEDEQTLALYTVQQNQTISKDALLNSHDHVESFHPCGYGEATP